MQLQNHSDLVTGVNSFRTILAIGIYHNNNVFCLWHIPRYITNKYSLGLWFKPVFDIHVYTYLHVVTCLILAFCAFPYSNEFVFVLFRTHFFQLHVCLRVNV